MRCGLCLEDKRNVPSLGNGRTGRGRDAPEAASPLNTLRSVVYERSNDLRAQARHVFGRRHMNISASLLGSGVVLESFRIPTGSFSVR